MEMEACGPLREVPLQSLSSDDLPHFSPGTAGKVLWSCEKDRDFRLARAREMLAYANDAERRQLELFYPELRSGADDNDVLPMDGDDLATIDLGDPPLFFLHVGRDWLEADVTTSTNGIDFGLIGCQLSSADFVGLREVPHAAASADLPSADLHLQSPVPAAKSASAAAVVAAASRRPRAFLSSLLVPSAKLAGGAATRKSASGSAAVSWTGVGRARHSGPVGAERHGARDAGRGTHKAGESDGGEMAAGRGDEQSGQRRGTWAGGENQEQRGKAGGGWAERGLRTWEILWKDSRWDGPMRRLTFSCNANGYKAIEGKISEWAAAAHSTAIMIDASKAAIRARSSSASSLSSLASATAPHRPNTGAGGGASAAAAASRAGAAAGGMSKRRGSEPRGVQRSGAGGAGSDRGGAGMRVGTSHEGAGGEAVPSGESTVGGWAVFYGSLPANGLAAVAPQAVQPRDEAQGQGQGRVDEQGEKEEEGEEEEEEDMECSVIRWGSVAVEGRFLPSKDAPSQLLSDGNCKAVAVALPARLRTARWMLLYSTARDGISLATLYRKVAKKGPSLLIVRDSRKHVFGCFTSEEWKVAPRYYGNGECFVFQVRPQLMAFRWTRANALFMLSSANSLALGGGDHYSLLLQSDLLSGYSGPCSTFGSCSLSSTEYFNVAHVEVWGFK
ncbi:hypothetical protein CLOM_g19874 [Closterium sp. NIES-68]|nr:hypothetical protein CLOM_g19874 [Closterium sp. NIES-68]GJP60923.1 hypothetical protein CLOP_g18141 [Closterium sp. NIES-67]